MSNEHNANDDTPNLRPPSPLLQRSMAVIGQVSRKFHEDCQEVFRVCGPNPPADAMRAAVAKATAKRKELWDAEFPKRPRTP